MRTCAADRGNVISYLASADAALSVLCTEHPSFIPRYDVQCQGDVRCPVSRRCPMSCLPPQTDFHRGHKKPWLGSHRPGVITLVLSFTQARGGATPRPAPDTAVASLQGRWGHMSGTLLTGGTCEYCPAHMSSSLEDMFALRPGQLGTDDHSLVVTR